MPERGILLFPFGEDFGGARIYDVGRALAELFDGDLVVGRGEQKDASSAMTFCGGVLASGRNVYDTGVNDLSRFRFTVRNYAFRGGAFLDRNYSNLVLRLFDENGMPLSAAAAKMFFRILTKETACGESDGMYRIFRGGSRSYLSYLRSFGPVNRLYLRVVSSPVLAPLLPSVPEGGTSERMRVGAEWIRIEGPDGEPFREDLIRLCVCISLGRLRSPVYIPDDFPFVAERVVSEFGARVIRVTDGSADLRKLFPLTDPNVQALLLLRLLEQEKCSFAHFVSRLPGFVLKQRDVSLSLHRGAVMRILASWGGELQRGIRFSDGRGSVRIIPKQTGNAFRVISEASTAEQAEDLCEFYSSKLKGLRPD